MTSDPRREYGAHNPIRGLMFGLLVSCPVWVVFAAGVVGFAIKH